MTRLALMHNTSFQLAIGDNFYTRGIKDSNDKRFQVYIQFKLCLTSKKNLANYYENLKGNL
jgi:hypothetical protein